MYLSASHVYPPLQMSFRMLNDPDPAGTRGFMGADEVEVIRTAGGRVEAPRSAWSHRFQSHLEQVVSWHQEGPGGVRTGDLQVTLVGVPMSLSALVRLVPETDGTLVDYPVT